MATQTPKRNGGGTGNSVQKAAEATPPANPAVAADLLSPEERHVQISRAAYRRAETRGFAPGADLEDWLLAEREVDNLTSR
jgi:hypothetical protein